MADERTSKVRAIRELNPTKLSPSLFSPVLRSSTSSTTARSGRTAEGGLFPAVHFNYRFKDERILVVRLPWNGWRFRRGWGDQLLRALRELPLSRA